MKALGTIIETTPREPTRDEIYCALFDFYDIWSEIDPRLEKHHAYLSRAADVFAHDLVNMATYANEILKWLEPGNIRFDRGASVVVVGAMSEAYIVSARSACDSLAIALGYIATEKPGQAPTESLRKLLGWAKKNPNRVRDDVGDAFAKDFDWFWRLRSLRDHLVHGGTQANIHCDGKQFNLWMHSPTKSWVTRQPLLPLLAEAYDRILDLGDFVAQVVQRVVPLPEDRRRPRVLHGVRINALHRLSETALEKANPSLEDMA
jgi:hypothetical protein